MIKPDPSLTMPVDKPELMEGDTLRDLAEKFELRGLSIDEANKQLEKIRE